MANLVKVKRSAVAGKTPTTSDLELGELAVNTYDGKLFLKKDNGTPSIIEIGAGGAGSGDVVGPSSATDNALARYDGTTGKLIQNGNITQDDNGNLANVNGISFDTAPIGAPTTAGSVYWDNGNGTPSVVINANLDLQLGQENLARVYNGTGSQINKGSVVAVTGAQGQRPSVALADADSEPLSASTLGVAAENIANGAEGFVATFGLIRGIDTSAFTAGDPLYLSQTAGGLTPTRPTAPAHTVFIGWAISINASSGEIFLNINNGWELDELHNVLITSPTSGNTLIYDASVGAWKNANLTDGTGISITEGAGSITIDNTGVTSAVAGTGISVSGATGTVTITNTAPDQTVALTGSGATSVSGTYPNFTISSTNTTYSPATSTVAGLIELGSDTVQTVAANSVSATASRSYALQVNSAGQGVVNVPWTDTTYTLPAATSTVRGGIELGSDTVQSVAANAVTATASRTYALQVNSAGQGVVNVPWTSSSGTVTSVAASGGTGISVSGSPITTSGTLTITNTGVTSLTAGSGISLSGSTGGITVSSSGLTALAFSSASNGYMRFSNGFMIQWGQASVAQNSTTSISFPTAFPTACRQVVVTTTDTENTPYVNGGAVTGFSTTAFTLFIYYKASTWRWIAMGY